MKDVYIQIRGFKSGFWPPVNLFSNELIQFLFLNCSFLDFLDFLDDELRNEFIF